MRVERSLQLEKQNKKTLIFTLNMHTNAQIEGSEWATRSCHSFALSLSLFLSLSALSPAQSPLIQPREPLCSVGKLPNYIPARVPG